MADDNGNTLPHAGTHESRQAAQMAELSNIDQARHIYEYTARPEGGTGPEAEVHFRGTVIEHNVTARMRALKFSGFIVRDPNGLTRRSPKGSPAAVFRAVPNVNWAEYKEATRDVPLSRLEPVVLRLVAAWRSWETGGVGEDREAVLHELLRLYGINPNAHITPAESEDPTDPFAYLDDV